jgi:hypothetical protein
MKREVPLKRNLLDWDCLIKTTFSDITHPPTSPAIRTRSTSTINSESSGSQQRPTQQAVNAERQSSSGQTTASTNLRRSTDQRILVVWLERIEDMGQFPYGKNIVLTR